MAKLFQPIRFWMARFTCRKSSASSSSSCPSRPSSGLQPATIRWRAFVRRPSGRPASTKHTSATAARRSPVSSARRPRSRLGIPARLRRSGGRHRFRQASSMPGERRQSKVSAISFGVNRPGFVPRRSGSRLVVLSSPKLQQEAATAPEISVTVAARSAPRQFSSHFPPSHQR